MIRAVIFCVLMGYWLSPQAVAVASAQPASATPNSTRGAEERISEATHKELRDFYEKVKSLNEECRLKREALKLALSEEAKQAIEDRKEEREAENGNKE